MSPLFLGHSATSFVYVFFFSSRRRHTRYIGDWSSDVCSSDLDPAFVNPNIDAITMTYGYMRVYEDRVRRAVNTPDRSEERRVGKEGRKMRAQDYENKEVSSGEGSEILSESARREPQHLTQIRI